MTIDNNLISASCRPDAPRRQDRSHCKTVRWCAVWERRTNPHFDHRFYDALSRLLEADYNYGDTVYTYGYDAAGNLVNMEGTTRTYNAANQMTNDGGDWVYTAQDGLGSVRGTIDGTQGVNLSATYSPYGVRSGALPGAWDSVFGFTGEQTDGGGQVYLRARYYTPK